MGLLKKNPNILRLEDNSSVNSVDLNDRKSPSMKMQNDVSSKYSNKTPHQTTPLMHRLGGTIVPKRDSTEY